MMKYRENGLSKALSIILAVAMLSTSPIGITQAYALGDGQPAATDVPLGTSEGLDSDAPPYTSTHDITPEVSTLSTPTTIEVSSELELINRLNLAQSGDTIRLTTDIMCSESNSSGNSPALIIKGKNITLDLNGKTLSIYNASYGPGLRLEPPSTNERNATQLHVTGSGTLAISSKYVGLSVYSSKFSSDASVAVDINGSFTVGIGGALADVDIQNGSVEGSDGISLSYNSNVTVKGSVKATVNVGVNLSNSKLYPENPEDRGCIVRVDSIEANGRGISMEGGEVTVDGTITAPTYIQFKDAAQTIENYLPETTKDGYRTYQHATGGTVWVKEAPAVCTIGAQRFTSLDAAIASVPAGGRATITLLQSVTHTKHIRVEKKTINLDLMDYDLLLDTSADGSYSPALMVIDGGNLNLIGSGTGEFNIKSHMTAISAVGMNTKATVHNVVAGDSTGVYMVGSGDNLGSSTVTVLGSITVGNGNGVEVNARGGEVLVDGEIRAGRIGVYVWSNPGTQVTVNDDITVDGDSSIGGIRAYGATTVAVTGDVTVRGTNCVGVHASGSTIKVGGNVASSGMGAHSDTKGKVEITGSLSAGTPFIVVGTAEMTADQGIRTPEGFLLYTYDYNTVQIGSIGVPAPVYTITFNLNGGTRTGGGALTQTVSGGGSVIAPTVSRSGYTFTGWDKALTNITQSLTVTATWSYNGGGSGSDSGGSGSSSDDSSNIIVTLPPPDKPNIPTQTEIKVDGKVDTRGNLTVAITDKNITDAINKAVAEAKANGYEANGITFVLNVGTGGKTVHNVTVNLPKTVQDTIIRKKIFSTIVVVDNPNIKIDMDLSTIKEINKQANTDVNITAKRVDSGKLNGNAKIAIGNRPVFDLKVNYGSGKAVQSFGAGSVSVTLPYTLSANEKAGNVQAVYVDEKGNVQWLTSSVYDSANKVLHFTTNHFSIYGVGYKQDAPDFTDIGGHWAKDDIEFVVNRGLFSGTSATTFSPNAAMTRGMFATALGRLANADVSAYKQSSFTDVKNDAYYMGYIEWANKNNMVTGIGDGKFAPDQSITREQMAAIMQSYAKTIGPTLPKVHAENTFTDNAKINAYAKDAVKRMQMAGVISGKNGNIFDPQGTATRAEVSAVLGRLVELK